MKPFTCLGLAAIFVAALSSVGCAADQAAPEEANAAEAQTSAASFSAKVVVPELTWKFWRDQPYDVPGFLSIELRASFGWFGDSAVESQSPLIAVGDEIYGAGEPLLRIGDDLTLYLSFKTTERTELYGGLGDENPTKGDDGVWQGHDAVLADVGKAGFYPVGKLVDVTPEELENGKKLRMDQIQLASGLRFAATRRDMSGVRSITLEATEAPALAGSEPTLLADKQAVLDAM